MMNDTSKPGGGDPGGVDSEMPDPNATTDSNARADAEAAFGGSTGQVQTSSGSSGGGSSGGSIVDSVVAKAGAVSGKVSAVQDEIVSIEREGEAAGGMVKATCDGAGNLKSIKIDPSLMDGEPAVLEELVVNAVKSAKEQVAKESSQKISDLLGGLPIPSSVASLLSQFIPSQK